MSTVFSARKRGVFRLYTTISAWNASRNRSLRRSSARRGRPPTLRDFQHTPPPGFQQQAGRNVLQGKSVILDVPTGAGKTYAFIYPLFYHWWPGNNDPQAQKSLLTISPLVALMEEQAALLNAHGILAIAIHSKCQNIDALMTNIAQNRYRVAFVGPETALGNMFGSIVLQSEEFRDACICLIIDEAHAVSEWGTDDFRPEFRELGALRSILKPGTLVLACSATLPAAIIADIQHRLRLESDSVRVMVSNRKPNIALSVRTMQHPEDSLADLLALVPVNAAVPEDIPVTLVYVNSRIDAEAIQDFVRRHLPDSIPGDIVEFYHRFIDDDDKTRILWSLSESRIRIVPATDALGWGMDLRNISRVILWKAPKTFCSLVQKLGRCARDPTQSGEGILYVSAAYHRKCVALLAASRPATDIPGPALVPMDASGDQVPTTQVPPSVPMNEVEADGVRAETTAEELTSVGGRAARTVAYEGELVTRDQLYLAHYVATKQCRRKPWDDFFENSIKESLVNTAHATISHSRGCDNCSPRDFVADAIELDDPAKRTAGRRSQSPPDVQVAASNVLKGLHWPNQNLVTGRSIMSDTVLAGLASGASFLNTMGDIEARVRWHWVPKYGHEVLVAL
ncbi:P-loop containing nucleoside triphosphate hydrolase protein, partial [Amylostereum chailletii]